MQVMLFNNNRKNKKNICAIFPAVVALFVLILISSSTGFAAGLEQLSTSQDLMAVWAADHDQGEQIYYSSFSNESWATPTQVSNAPELPFHPTAASGNDGKVWIIWSRQDAKGSSLHFSVSGTSGWSLPRQVHTALRTNTFSTIIVDTNNIPVIAWAGTDKAYSDIYWSQWNGKDWTPARKAHVDNEVPDLKPSLQLESSGKIILSWQTFKDGKYVTVSKFLQQERWVSAPDNGVEEKTKREEILSLPDLIQDKRKATVFIRDENGARSLRPSRW